VLESSSFFSSVPDSVVYNRGTYDNWDPDSRSYWFRPSDVAVGTDGAIYVADWYDARVGGHQMQDSTGYGRIFRITRTGDNPQPPALDLNTTEGQLEALRSPAPNVRVLGFQQLKAQGNAVLDEVKALLDADNPFHQARAVWLLAHLGSGGVQEVDRVFRSSPDPALRVAAFRALEQVEDTTAMTDRARAAARDDAPAVRRAAAIYLRNVPLAESRDAMVELARRYDGEDRWYLEAFGLAAEGEEAATYALLQEELAVAAEPSMWSDPWSDLVWRLHPVEAIEALQRRAAAPDVAWEEQKEAMVAIGFIDDRAAVDAMEALAQSDQPKVAERAAWWLDYRRTNVWYDLKDWAAEEQTPEEREALQAMQAEAKTVQDANQPSSERAAAVGAMAEDAIGSRMLMGMAINEDLPDPVRQAVQDSIFNSPDRTVRVLARHYLEDPNEGATNSAQRIAQMETDRQNGQMVFYAQCAVCHKAGPTGGDVGPELTGVKTMFDTQGLADAIIRPDAGIAHGYTPWQVQTNDGAVRYGFLLAENEQTIVLKDAVGQRHIIGRDRIASRTQLEGVSLMPGPEELQLDPQDIADVVAFLRTLEAE
jgi:putative heme-binding domain-containing protein